MPKTKLKNYNRIVKKIFVRCPELSDFEHIPYICYIGSDSVNYPSYSWSAEKRHSHPNRTLLQYTLSGCGIFKCNGKTFNVDKGKAFIYNMDMPNSSYYYPPDSSEPWDFVYCTFCNCQDIIAELNLHHGEIYNLGIDNVLIKKLLAYLETPQTAARLNLSQSYSLTAEIMTEICRLAECPDSDKPKRINLMMKAREIIYEQRNNHFSLACVAEKLNISPEYLCRSFKNVFNITPKHYHERLRIEEICTRLQEQKCPIKEVAAAIGFEDVSNFNKFFKKHVGVSPSEFQRRRKHIIIHDFLPDN